MSRPAATRIVPEPPEAPLLPVPGLDYGVLDELLGYALRRAQNALYLDFHRATAELDVSPQRFAALVLVGRNPGMRQGVLGQAMGLHRSGALRLTDWLTGRGWVERRDDAEDARSWGLHLTAQGKRKLTVLERRVRAHDEGLMSGLGENAARLKADLERLAIVAAAAAAAIEPSPSK
ncbi:MarR family winged helix-turn-helix transcriptional regulator [Roseateles chitosanitabidus]|uniref:MarR family winged helix-turn-helix transcriptional regulator n=1 Tax=Roseateles chitosanitabidus TaxID=65048 RepID=UPI0008336C0C|nr:MarR family transcriptional regulator [Roseateles chitosanitabidus]MBO9687659.1 MarR family transcriptional regulator [Roseateles chitosanitabidus]